MSLSQLFQLIGAISGFVAAATLFYGAIEVPLHKRTWNGEAPHEKAREVRNRILQRIGIPATLLSFIAQMALIFLPIR